jgi:hypothetical protein
LFTIAAEIEACNIARLFGYKFRVWVSTKVWLRMDRVGGLHVHRLAWLESHEAFKCLVVQCDIESVERLMVLG